MPRVSVAVFLQNTYVEIGIHVCSLQHTLWSKSCCGDKLIKMVVNLMSSMSLSSLLPRPFLKVTCPQAHFPLLPTFLAQSPHKHVWTCAFFFPSSKFVVCMLQSMSRFCPGTWLVCTPQAVLEQASCSSNPRKTLLVLPHKRSLLRSGADFPLICIRFVLELWFTAGLKKRETQTCTLPILVQTVLFPCIRC